MRITKVTTKTGDAGETGLGSGKRVQKNHPRIMVLGELDHLNSIIGWAISACNDELIKPLKNIQQDIFNIGADMSLPERDADLLKKERLTDLEHQIDRSQMYYRLLRNLFCRRNELFLGYILLGPLVEIPSEL